MPNLDLSDGILLEQKASRPSLMSRMKSNLTLFSFIISTLALMVSMATLFVFYSQFKANKEYSTVSIESGRPFFTTDYYFLSNEFLTGSEKGEIQAAYPGDIKVLQNKPITDFNGIDSDEIELKGFWCLALLQVGNHAAYNVVIDSDYTTISNTQNLDLNGLMDVFSKQPKSKIRTKQIACGALKSGDFLMLPLACVYTAEGNDYVYEIIYRPTQITYIDSLTHREYTVEVRAPLPEAIFIYESSPSGGELN